MPWLYNRPRGGRIPHPITKTEEASLYAYITGIVDELLADRAVLEAGGVGYELFCSSMTLKRLRAGQKERLYTHLHLTEGVMALYGFYEPEEKDMFRRLLTVTRVGPKLALRCSPYSRRAMSRVQL
ncbi:MAG: hypothetical protein C0413_01120 [Clostridiales bacterium]|nr:hypothetical protein [Clostridiales bacterium]